MKLILILLSVMVLAGGCVNDHVQIPVYKCSPDHPIAFEDIAGIVSTKCAITGCHNAQNNYIPHLTDETDFSNNRADCRSQILDGAMPPVDAIPLTQDEKAKILCWLGN